MKTPLYKEYANRQPLAVLPLSNFGGLAVLDILPNYGETLYIVAWDFGTGYQQIRRHKEQYSTAGRPFFTKGNRRYYLDQFMKTERSAENEH